jgi:hypothetical protein
VKKPINEIKKMQHIAGLITESEYQESMINEESNFDKKALDFLNNNKKTIAQAIRFYKDQDDSYEYSLIDTIYQFFNDEIGEEWTKQISTPSAEDEKVFTYGWSDDKDEKFVGILKNFLKIK